MKKRGFTLVELIAAVIIVGLLVMIAFPVITNIMRSSKKKTFKSEALTFVRNFDNAFVNKLSNEFSDEVTKGKISILTHNFGDGDKEYYYLCMELSDMVNENFTDKNLEDNYKGYVEMYMNKEDQSRHTYISMTDGTNEVVASEEELTADDYQVKNASGSGAFTCSSSLTLYNGVEQNPGGTPDNNGENTNPNNGGGSNNNEDSNVNIVYATLMHGDQFNSKIRELAKDGTEDGSFNYSIKKIVKTNTAPKKKDNYINVADETSNKPIYAWFKNDTLYIYSEANKIFMNRYTYGAFSYLKNLTDIDLSYFDTSRVIYMNGLFSSDSSLTSINLGNFNTSRVTDMSRMFAGCSSIKSIDLSKLDTSNVESMSSMFYGMTSLESIDLSTFDTSNLKSMSGMFEGCSSIKELDLYNFNTSKVDYMGSVFEDMTSLTSLNISSFDTSNVTSMAWMFAGSSAIETLDLSSFSAPKLKNMHRMFRRMTNLKTIYVSNLWSNENVLTNGDSLDRNLTFEGCSNLVGSAGSSFETIRYANKDTAIYARVDDPENGKPGYFTLKTN